MSPQGGVLVWVNDVESHWLCFLIFCDGHHSGRGRVSLCSEFARVMNGTGTSRQFIPKAARLGSRAAFVRGLVALHLVSVPVKRLQSQLAQDLLAFGEFSLALKNSRNATQVNVRRLSSVPSRGMLHTSLVAAQFGVTLNLG
jgi:hypothetical protein